MAVKINIKFLCLFFVALILLVGCSAEYEASQTHIPLPTPDHLKGEGLPSPILPGNYKSLLALAEDRDKWFLASDITEEVVEGLYDTWSVICRKEVTLSEYEFLVYRIVRPLVLGGLEMKLEDVQNADRYYEVDTRWRPWVYVKQTWKVEDKVIFGPNYQLYVQEAGKDIGSRWRYYDC